MAKIIAVGEKDRETFKGGYLLVVTENSQQGWKRAVDLPLILSCMSMMSLRWD
jgi:hypothetical protein